MSRFNKIVEWMAANTVMTVIAFGCILLVFIALVR